MTQSVVNHAGVADSYLRLVRELPLRPIRTKSDYRSATAMADRLAVYTEGSLDEGEQDYLDTLSLLIEDYDRTHRPRDLSALRGLDVVRHLMEENEMTVSALGKVLGSKGVASEILSGKRSLSKSHMSKLAKRFNVDAGVFFP